MNNQWEIFSAETLQRLFIAVEEDDKVDGNSRFPGEVDATASAEKIRSCYSLCLQFWQEGVARVELLQLINKLMSGEELTQSEKRRYKFIRARYKHLRFAQRLYGHQHEANLVFRLTTASMGHFQDAFRNHNRKKIFIHGVLLRLLLSKPLWKRVEDALYRLRLADERGFTTHGKMQMLKLRRLLDKPTLTGKEFHSVRKIISQQVSYYDTLRSIDPNDRRATDISRFLATINGLMGDKHDVMVTARLNGGKEYNLACRLDDNVRQPIESFLASYPL